MSVCFFPVLIVVVVVFGCGTCLLHSLSFFELMQLCISDLSNSFFFQGGSTIATKEQRFKPIETETPGPGSYNVDKLKEQKLKATSDFGSGKVNLKKNRNMLLEY